MKIILLLTTIPILAYFVGGCVPLGQNQTIAEEFRKDPSQTFVVGENSYKIFTHDDKFADIKIEYIKNNPINTFSSECKLEFSSLKYTFVDSTVYVVGIRYDGANWMYINPSIDLGIILDDTLKLHLKCLNVQQDVRSGDNIFFGSYIGMTERATYRISFEDLTKISRAASVKIKLYGQSSRTGEFTRTNFEYLNVFMDFITKKIK